jgi:hypothetical protein
MAPIPSRARKAEAAGDFEAWANRPAARTQIQIVSVVLAARKKGAVAHAFFNRLAPPILRTIRRRGVNPLSQFVQALHRVTTLYTLQGCQPAFDGTHNAERNLVIRKPLEALQLA